MKAFKNWGFGPRKSKSGFTLIELLIVMVILAILAGVVVMAVGGVFGTARGAAYNAVKDDIQNAVTAYATDHEGNFPINTSAAAMAASANCTAADPCYYLNMSALLVSQDGMLRELPDGLRLVAGTDCAAPNDNCDCGGTLATTCDGDNHYIWGATSRGVVFSRCVDTTDKLCTSNASGYQGQWP